MSYLSRLINNKRGLLRKPMLIFAPNYGAKEFRVSKGPLALLIFKEQFLATNVIYVSYRNG